MFGLPIWAWQLIIAVLKATGMIGWAEALTSRLVLSLADATVKFAASLKTDPTYPGDFKPDGKAVHQQPDGTLVNFTSGKPPG